MLLFARKTHEKERQKGTDRGSGELWRFVFFNTLFLEHIVQSAALGLFIPLLLLFIYYLLAAWYILAINLYRGTHFYIICVSFVGAHFRRWLYPHTGSPPQTRDVCETSGLFSHLRRFVSWSTCSLHPAFPKLQLSTGKASSSLALRLPIGWDLSQITLATR